MGERDGGTEGWRRNEQSSGRKHQPHFSITARSSIQDLGSRCPCGMIPTDPLTPSESVKEETFAATERTERDPVPV